jgi:hypothetical protein
MENNTRITIAALPMVDATPVASGKSQDKTTPSRQGNLHIMTMFPTTEFPKVMYPVMETSR